MGILETAGQILSLFIIMLIGYALNKCKVLNADANARLVKLVINVAMPAQIITAFVSNQGIVSNQEVVTVFGISLLMHLIYFIVGVLFIYGLFVKKEQRGTYYFMMMFGNVGFMGFPVIEAIYGKENLIYAVIFNVVFQVLVYSVGIIIIRRPDISFSPKKLLNMPLISASVAIALFFLKIRLPGPVNSSLEYLGNITTPMAMLVLGSIIANMKVKELFDEWRVYLFAAFKLLIVPLAVIMFFKVIPIKSEVVRGCMIILSAMPVATNASMLAIEYEGDIKLTSKGIFFTTLICMITIPVMIAIMKAL